MGLSNIGTIKAHGDGRGVIRLELGKGCQGGSAVPVGQGCPKGDRVLRKEGCAPADTGLSLGSTQGHPPLPVLKAPGLGLQCLQVELAVGSPCMAPCQGPKSGPEAGDPARPEHSS